MRFLLLDVADVIVFEQVSLLFLLIRYLVLEHFGLQNRLVGLNLRSILLLSTTITQLIQLQG